MSRLCQDVAVRRRRVSATATWWCLPSFFITTMSEALGIQETMEPGMWLRP